MNNGLLPAFSYPPVYYFAAPSDKIAETYTTSTVFFNFYKKIIYALPLTGWVFGDSVDILNKKI